MRCSSASGRRRMLVELNLPMPVRTVRARAEVKANESCIALQRGPVVYCVEAPDNAGNAWNLVVSGRILLRCERAQIFGRADCCARRARACALAPGRRGRFDPDLSDRHPVLHMGKPRQYRYAGLAAHANQLRQNQYLAGLERGR